MSKIEGKAKKYDGTAIDYVSIFNWVSGKCIAQVVPDAAGNWQFSYFEDLNVGVTYVADGCEPITHGPYQIIYEAAAITSGYLLLKYCHVDFYRADNDVNATTEPTWDAYFRQTKDIAPISYITGEAPLEAPLESAVIESFSSNWNIKIFGANRNDDSDEHLIEFEVLDANNIVIFALRSAKDSGRNAGLWYGSNLGSLTKTGTSGSSSITTSGFITFTDSLVSFTNDRSSDYNQSFDFAADFSKAKKVRVSGMAKTFATNKYSNAVAYLRIEPPTE